MISTTTHLTSSAHVPLIVAEMLRRSHESAQSLELLRRELGGIQKL
jgi:hypothetical protein